jgi:hypothetical protein
VIGHGWLALYPFLMLVLIGACLVVAGKNFSEPRMQVSAAIALIIALALPIYIILAPPVVNCYEYLDNPNKIASLVI